MTARMMHKNPFGVSGNPYNMFFASLILHLIVLAAVMISIPGSSRPLTFGAAYSVALVGPEAVQTSTTAASLKDMMQPSKPDQPVILKRDISKSEPSLIEKNDAARQHLEKALSALKKKSQLGADAEATANIRSSQAAAGQATGASESSRIDDYTRFIWPSIKKNWVLPASLMPKDNVTAIIEVRIGQSGALEYIGFEKRSGNSYFDESALRAVKKSAPFPPLAGWTGGRFIEIGIRFHSAELR